MIKNLLSNSHNIKKYNLYSRISTGLNDNIVGRINFKDIIYNGNTIILKKQMINPEHVIDLKRIGYSFIQVYSEQLGGICFVNKKIKEH